MLKNKLNNLRNKFTERANTLFTSMNNDEEEKDYGTKIERKVKGLEIKKNEDEGKPSSLENEDTKRKYDAEEHKEIKTRILEDDKESRRVDLLYPTMKDKEEKKEEKLDKIDIKKEKEKETKQEKERSKLTDNAGNNETKHSLKDFGLNDEDYEVSDNTISPKNENVNFEKINNVKFQKVTENKEIENLKKNAKETRRNINDEYIKNAAKLEQFGIDNSNNFLMKKGAEIVYGKETIENLNMSKAKSYLDTDYAKQHKIYNNYNETPTELREYFKNKISEQIGKDKLDKTKGIFIDANTETSKNLKRNLLSNKKFIEKLNKYESALKNNYSVNDSIQFSGKLRNAIGRADIRNMHINKNGDIELYITDVYDFNEEERNKLVRIGRDRQNKGEITPYFYAYRVVIQQKEKNKK